MDDQEPIRPSYHFAPAENWMNDPNGMVYYDGEYHLYYQHNPQGRMWGHMSWGHAVSRDLVHWEHLPIAIMEEPEVGYTIFSGSAVVDWENRSGFGQGDPPIVACYTAFYPECGPLQNVHIAYSLDRGRTFRKYEGNPVIDVEARKFGDPKVFWHEQTGRWVMVNIHGYEQGVVDLYASENLREWAYLSTFEAPEAVPGIWECPDLFALPVEGEPGASRWLLKVNGPYLRSYFFVGDWDGRVFHSELVEGQAIEFDYGNTYAEVTYNGLDRLDGRRVMLGWIRMNPAPDRPWTGMQSVPRELSLRRTEGGWQVLQRPVAELDALRQPPYETIEGMEGRIVEAGQLVNCLLRSSSALEVRVELEISSADDLGLRFQLGQNQAARVGYRPADETLYVTGAGRGKVEAPLAVEESLRLHILLDRSVIEVYAGDGRTVIVDLLEPVAMCERISAYAEGGEARIRRFAAWHLVP